jgi:hypothetical protein
MTEPMNYREVAGYAATWGSFMTSGDPGACMYGFDETGRPQNEGHRANCLEWIEACKKIVAERPDEFDESESDDLESLRLWLESAPALEGRDWDYAFLKAEFKMYADSDIYGVAMEWFFEVGFEMDDRRLTIPADWHFRRGAMGRGRDITEHPAAIIVGATDDALEQFGNLLSRYVDRIKHAGKDY